MKDNIKLSIIEPSKIQIPLILDIKGSDKWVRYGSDNLFPQFLWENYLLNSNLQAIINTMADYIAGNNILCSEMINKDGETLKEIIKKCIVDYLIFGGFTVEVIRNKERGIAEIYYQDIQNVRVNEPETKAYLSSNWASWDNKPAVLSLNSNNLHFLYYVKNPITRGIYPIPIYQGALKSILILNSTRDFHLNNLQNNFTGNSIINFNNGIPSEDIQEEIEHKIREKFSGSTNAGKFILSFNDNKDSAVTIERLESDNFGELYQSLQDSSKKDIFTAFRIAPILVGVNPDNNGFSKTEYLEAFTLYNRTVIQPIQNIIREAFMKIGLDINFISFKLEDTLQKTE